MEQVRRAFAWQAGFIAALLCACGGGDTAVGTNDRAPPVLAAGVAQESSIPMYHVKQIPLPADAAVPQIFVSHNSLNQLGQFIGRYFRQQSGYGGLFYDGTTTHKIPDSNCPTACETWPWHLNDSGVVVGERDHRAFRWSLQDGISNPMPSASIGSAFTISDAGAIAGFTDGKVFVVEPKNIATVYDGTYPAALLENLGYMSPNGHMAVSGTVNGVSSPTWVRRPDGTFFDAWSGGASGYLPEPSGMTATDDAPLLVRAYRQGGRDSNRSRQIRIRFAKIQEWPVGAH